MKSSLIAAVLSLLSSAAIWAHLEMNTREPIVLLFALGLFVFFKSSMRVRGRRIWCCSLVLGILLALCYTLAKIDLMQGHSSYYLYLVVRLAGFSALFSNIFALVFSRLECVSLVMDAGTRRLSRKGVACVVLGG